MPPVAGDEPSQERQHVQYQTASFCIDMHARELMKEGLGIEKLVLLQVWHDAGKLFDARERGASVWAETLDSRRSASSLSEKRAEAASKSASGTAVSATRTDLNRSSYEH